MVSISEIAIKEQEILVGSSRLTNINKNSFDRVNYMLTNMEYNKAYIYTVSKINDKEKSLQILEELKKKYINYRKDWNQALDNYDKKNNFTNHLNNISKPLSVDIETAAICDLACPHCSREYIITPDKLMSFDLYKKLIEQVSDLEVPSIKLNWRGEPLLNTKIHELVDYAKKKGILEVAINTNATTLDKKKSKMLIESGLDVIIFSFDGGTSKTYEKMRPGRFKENKLDTVYNNIKNFSEIKKEMNAKFPISKIQMILTKESRNEVDNFFNLFDSSI